MNPILVVRPLRLKDFGGIAQLVERLVRNEKVRGSNPLTSTILPCRHSARRSLIRGCIKQAKVLDRLKNSKARPVNSRGSRSDSTPLNLMKKKTYFVVCLAGIICLPLRLGAGEKSSWSSRAAAQAAKWMASSEAAKSSARPIPFHGMVSAVDQTAKTFTIAGKGSSRVFKVSDKTAVTKAGKPATMTDITENVEVSGAYWKAADGSLEAKMVKVGPMGKEKAKGEKAAKNSASPTISPSASPKP